MNKIVLGTVQFGINYGINNTTGQVTQEEVTKILSIAAKNGVKTLDTSSAYGTSEQTLGNALSRTGLHFDVVSKYPKSGVGVCNTFKQSLQNLNVDHLYGYLVHHFEFYLEHQGIFDDMRKLKDEGLVKKIGFSLYTTKQLQYLIDHKVQFDILQFPYNVFDRQFEPYMEQLYKDNVEIHTRSAFLQGLFFKDTKALPYKLIPLKRVLDNMHNYCKSRGLSVERLALGYVLHNPYVKGALIGVDNHHQLENNLQVAAAKLTEEDVAFIKSIEINDKELLNPVNWK